MTDENKLPIFGPSFQIDPARHEPHAGKSFWMADLMQKADVAATIIGNCTTTIFLKPDMQRATTEDK